MVVSAGWLARGSPPCLSPITSNRKALMKSDEVLADGLKNFRGVFDRSQEKDARQTYRLHDIREVGADVVWFARYLRTLSLETACPAATRRTLAQSADKLEALLETLTLLATDHFDVSSERLAECSDRLLVRELKARLCASHPLVLEVARRLRVLGESHQAICLAHRAAQARHDEEIGEQFRSQLLAQVEEAKRALVHEFATVLENVRAHFEEPLLQQARDQLKEDTESALAKIIEAENSALAELGTNAQVRHGDELVDKFRTQLLAQTEELKRAVISLFAQQAARQRVEFEEALDALKQESWHALPVRDRDALIRDACR
jgi:hypothetical protein